MRKPVNDLLPRNGAADLPPSMNYRCRVFDLAGLDSSEGPCAATVGDMAAQWPVSVVKPTNMLDRLVTRHPSLLIRHRRDGDSWKVVQTIQAAA